MCENSGGILSGIRVLDLTHVVAGPYASLYLAMFGAEVIKIENPGTDGGMLRHTGPFAGDISLRFCTLNHNKKSVVIDLSKNEGKELFLKMVAKSDIVLDNFRNGVMKRLGFDFEALRKINPKIVCGSITGFGSIGPYKDLPAYDFIAQAMSGIMWLNGSENDPPVKVGTSIADIIAGINLVVGVLAALHKAELTGKGCQVETCLTNALVSSLMMDQIACLNFGQLPSRIGNGYREWCPSGAYKAQDGYYVLGPGTDEMFQTLAIEILQMPELAEDPRFAYLPERIKRRSEVDKIISDWSSQRTVAEICDILYRSGIPATKVNNTLDTISDEHISGVHNMFPTYVQPNVGNVRVTDLPIRFPQMETTPITPAPKLGEQTDQVLRELLDMDDSAICALRERDVIG